MPAVSKWGNVYYKVLQAVSERGVAELVPDPTDNNRVLHRQVSLPTCIHTQIAPNSDQSLF